MVVVNITKEDGCMSDFGDGRCKDCGGKGGLHYSDCVTEYQGDSGGTGGGSSTIIAVIGVILGFVLLTLFFSLIGADPSGCPTIILIILFVVFISASVAVVDTILK